ncbi:MAG: M42 family metallopeptidase [bacterium]|nr:M42 family metallopeptidase [bacterium]
MEQTKLKEIVKNLVEAYSPSGDEGAVKDVVDSYLKDIAQSTEEDALGNKVWILKGKGENLPKLALIAHGDEVGFVVEKITSSGFLQVLELGGWNPATTSSQLMKVKAGDKWINGVTTAAAPHLLKDSDKGGERKIYVDIGASTPEEVLAQGVEPGSVIVPEASFVELLNKRYIAKAFDNRAGVAMMTALAIELAEKNIDLPVELQLAVSVQEEVGTRGARTYYNTFKPDYAVILEGPPADDTPEISGSLKQGVLGKGPQVRTYDRTMIPSRVLVDKLKQSAKQCEIPVQLSVRKTGGTDAREIHLSGPGVPSVVFSIPVRGAHSPHSVIDLGDLEQAVTVLVDFVARF